MGSEVKKFALIGAAGYIAPRHMEAIKANKGNLIAAVDPNDSVGILDRYFPNTQFFISSERFERFVVKQQKVDPLNYISICSPNYHHDTHCRFALMHGSDAICEKPLVLNPWNLEALQESERSTSKRIHNILQLRLHPEIIKLKQFVSENQDRIFDIDLAYITSRGPWYNISWKGEIEKSGGITSNIGVHFFDMLIWIFGDVEKQQVHAFDNKFAAGNICLKQANVRWFLSVDPKHLPQEKVESNLTMHRSLSINGREIDFTQGFEDLHIKSYENILKGKGFTTDDVHKVIQLGYDIRNSQPIGIKGEYHPLLSIHA